MIDFVASEGHFLEHLAPVWNALPEDVRGTFYASGNAVTMARRLGLEVTGGTAPRNAERPVVVAASRDLLLASRVRSKVVLLEHGAGQTYSNRHTSYAGGGGRSKVKLFLCPNEHVAGLNRRHYPTARTAVIGSPRLDALAAIGQARRPRGSGDPRATVALVFHWRCMVAPEAGTAFDHYARRLVEIRHALEAEGVEVLGHAHPRMIEEAAPVYRAAGIEPVAWWPEIVARADLVAVDNSSTLFEFAALGRPVVVLNAPWFRRDVEHGLRFWRDAEVGLQVDRPEDLAETVLFALTDPPAVARVRAEVVDRIYPVRDGSSARLAASALGSLVNRRVCPVCGAAHATCGPETDDVAVDAVIPLDEKDPSMLKRYPNPAKAGAYLRLNDRDAERLGLLGQEVTASETATASAPEDPPLTEGDATAATLGLGASLTSAPTPKGALTPSGPTARARAKAAAEAAPAPAPTPEPTAEEAPPVTETETTPEPAPDAPAETPAAPKDKARPTPSTSPTARRRRRPAPDGS